MKRTIHPVQRFKGRVKIPGDKSISHRALILGSIAEGKTEIFNLSPGEDIQTTRTCLETLGVEIEDTEESVLIKGSRFYDSESPIKLNSENSGTTMRLLAGVLAAQPIESILTGDTSLCKRPMKRILDPLSRMGACIRAKDGMYPPIRIHGARLSPIRYDSPLASAQVKSCILLAGLFTHGETRVTEPVLSRDHTERMLPLFGVDLKRDALNVSIKGPAMLQGTVIHVPGDLSSAAFFIVAATMIPEADITLTDVGTNSTRTGILDALRIMGADIRLSRQRTTEGESRADIHIKHAPLKGMVIDNSWIPRLIDEIPIIAVAATQATGKTVVRHAGELRVKETDRIHGVVTNLQRMGIQIDEQEDGFIIEGPQELTQGSVDSYGDHRIAMAFAIAGLVAKGATVIENAECVEISYPSFFHTLKEFGHE